MGADATLNVTDESRRLIRLCQILRGDGHGRGDGEGVHIGGGGKTDGVGLAPRLTMNRIIAGALLGGTIIRVGGDDGDRARLGRRCGSGGGLRLILRRGLGRGRR